MKDNLQFDIGRWALGVRRSIPLRALTAPLPNGGRHALASDLVALLPEDRSGDAPQVAPHDQHLLLLREVSIEDFRELGGIRAAGDVAPPDDAVGPQLLDGQVDFARMRVG